MLSFMACGKGTVCSVGIIQILALIEMLFHREQVVHGRPGYPVDDFFMPRPADVFPTANL